MQVLIDGDACPVKEIAINLCQHYCIPITILMDDAHEYRNDYAKVLIVDRGFDHVDHVLFGLAQKGDLAISQDYGLAAILLGKKVDVINQNGMFYTNDNIDFLLQQRYDHAQLRKAKKRYTHYDKRTTQQDQEFETQLDNYLRNRINSEV